VNRRFTLEDVSRLPKRAQDEVAAQLFSPSKDTITIAIGAPKPRLRQSRGERLNKTERAFLAHLQTQFNPRWIYSQAVTLQIANGCRYTPDFLIFVGQDIDNLQLRAYEVKGFMRDDAAVKIKVAARAFPAIRFFLATKRKGGGWVVEPVYP
jgi:hypothetical protein